MKKEDGKGRAASKIIGVIMLSLVIIMLQGSSAEALTQCPNPTPMQPIVFIVLHKSNQDGMVFIAEVQQRIADAFREKEKKTFNKNHNNDPLTNPCLTFMHPLFRIIWVDEEDTPNVQKVFKSHVHDLRAAPENGFVVFEKDGIKHIRIVNVPDFRAYLLKNHPNVVDAVKNQQQREEVAVCAEQVRWFIGRQTPMGWIMEASVLGSTFGNGVMHWSMLWTNKPLMVVPCNNDAGWMLVYGPNGEVYRRNMPAYAPKTLAHEEGHYLLKKGGHEHNDHTYDVPPPTGVSLPAGNVMGYSQSESGWTTTRRQADAIKKAVDGNAAAFPASPFPLPGECSSDGIFCSGSCPDAQVCMGDSQSCACCDASCNREGCTKASDCGVTPPFVSATCSFYKSCQTGSCKKGSCVYSYGPSTPTSSGMAYELPDNNI